MSGRLGSPTYGERSGQRSSLDQYLDEVGAFALLTPTEEVELARAIELGHQAQERLTAAERAGRPLDGAQRAMLRRLVHAGAEARHRFVQSNLRLVVSIARRYRNSNVAQADLVQEGNLGLLRAVEKFDWRKGFRFSTYATWWIRQAISRAVCEQSRTIRVPGHIGEVLGVVARCSADIFETMGREATLAELAAASGYPEATVRDALRSQHSLVSLSAPSSDSGGELADRVADRHAASPDQEAVTALEGDAVRESLGRLDDREREVLELRFGFGDHHPQTLEQVSARFGFTRERARQVEAKALTKLRHPCLPGHLRMFAVLPD
jgi:RNA polymerase sigma factor (sigma-70 family)